MAKLGIGLALRDQGDLLAALEQIVAATTIVETLRLQRAAVQFRVWYLASKQRYFEELVDLLAELDLRGEAPASGPSYAERALQAAERKRARTFLDSFGEPTPRQHADSGKLMQEQALMDEIESLQAQLYAGAGDPAAIRAEQDDLLLRLDSLRGEIRSTDPDYRQAERPVPLTVAQIRQQVLDEDSTLVVYSLGERRSFVWTLDRDTPLELRPLAGRERLSHEVEHALEQVIYRTANGQPRRDAALAQLGDSLLSVLDGLPAKPRLVIVPDGPLEQVPFAALRLPISPRPDSTDPTATGSARTDHTLTGRRYLLETHEIAMLPSASSLGAIRRAGASSERPPVITELALFADPVFSAGDERLTAGPRSARAPDEAGGSEPLSRLPSTRQEAAAVGALFQPENRYLQIGFDARKDDRFWQLLGGARLLHFATHALVDSERPQLSALALSQVDEQGLPIAGYLFAHELFATRLAAELVVLSACGTGTGREIPGEGIQGLSRAFLYAGAPRVLMSLWNVDDLSTASLMEHFYLHLLRDQEAPATALRQAQLQLLSADDDRWQAPYYWAPFALVGDWRLDRQRHGGQRDDGNPFEKEDAGVAQAPPAATTPGYPVPPDDSPPKKGRPPEEGY
jgi:CHAT domain-containing protein